MSGNVRPDAVVPAPKPSTAALSQERGWLSQSANVLLVLLLTFSAHSVLARTIFVGPDGEVQTIAEAARIARDGDTIRIQSGEYRADVASWHQKQLAIIGDTPRPVLIAEGKSAEGKAIWVFKNGQFTVDNIAFRGTRVADQNGAGIRLERGHLLVRNCEFSDNQMGILTANFEDATLSVIDSLFSAAPQQTGSLPHLLYIGRIARAEVSGSRFHGGHRGHLIKSRARETVLRYNLIFDGPGGKASYEVDLPNGGDALLVGNIIGQSRHTENPVLIAYGAEGAAWPLNRLRLSHNTLTSDRLSGTWFVRVWEDRFSAVPEIHLSNNLSMGLGLFTMAAPGSSEGNWPLPPGALAVDLLDFRLSPGSLLRGRVKPHPGADPMRPANEFSLPIGTRPLPELEQWAPGAVQTTEY